MRSNSIELLKDNKYIIGIGDCTSQYYSYGKWRIANDSIQFIPIPRLEFTFIKLDSLSYTITDHLTIIDKGSFCSPLPQKSEIIGIKKSGEIVNISEDILGNYIQWKTISTIVIIKNQINYEIEVPEEIKYSKLLVILYPNNQKIEEEVIGSNRIALTDLVLENRGMSSFGSFIKMK